MTRKAVGYVSDIVLGRTGEIISREEQKKAIMEYAASNDIEIVAIFEDNVYNEDVLTRPGIQKLLACETICDCLLVERVWALSRNTKILKMFLAEMSSRKVKLEAATTLWDCVSQMTRHYFAGKKGLKSAQSPVESFEFVKGKACHIRKPAKLHFLRLNDKPHRV